MKDSAILAAVAMVCLTVIMCFALHHGINHFVLAGVVIVIAGLGGYSIRVWRERV